MVDRALVHVVLDRLNAMSGLTVFSICAGHPRGPGDRQASVIFQGRSLNSFAPYLKRCGATTYEPIVTLYNMRWHMEIRSEFQGQAPDRWWYGLVDVLEENPECARWMLR
jgi:hypothetical protein